ncbi:type III-B CRISPR module RAMP protein Cmr4 [Pullulanibacillus camelliae]|uniref:Type III-B CRISPR module RAMP protein Cmr4 n=1 Tax=Pullulanibacillus camelliae TaxID=1707096 RepID=A0A8J2VSE7_9BACL|nr:type III-B CRISPR module RAMP protein Cmr4 [Pullulanibacillus camelliae]GGE35336.1 type III-B CRISPR module RAMP protein Cmr4 [Pullulanibacillus camelliae]
MYTEKKALFLKVLTPLHAGSGTELHAVDLSIQREAHTGFPKIEASTFKGSLRHFFDQTVEDKTRMTQLFGAEDMEETTAAALALTDVRLLFFPVRSAKGIYALITCPMVVERFQREMKSIGIEYTLPDMSQLPLLCKKDSEIKIENNKKDTLKYSILLDDYAYEIPNHNNEEGFSIFLKELEKVTGTSLSSRAVLLSNDDFKDFVMHSTSIITRIAVGDDGAAEDKALFTEEYLQEESILYSLVFMSDAKTSGEKVDAHNLMADFTHILQGPSAMFQIGADATLGKGFVQAYLAGGGENA